MSRADFHQLLDPAAIASGENLGLLARTVVEGFQVGNHRSPFRGFAIEFAQHREYSSGDDVRHLDWKVLGRTDRYYIKQYEQDTNFVAHILLDGSESMNYGRGRLTKLHYAKCLAACLAYLVLLQRDAASVSIFDTETREHVARTDNLGKMAHILERLASFRATQPTRLGAAMNDLSRLAKSRGIVILLSDFLDDEEGFTQELQRLRFIGHEVVVFQVLDPDELEFPFGGRVEFVGLEGAPRLETNPADIRRSYLAELDAMLLRIRRVCEKAGCHYVLANTGHALAETLSGYLVFRHRACAR